MIVTIRFHFSRARPEGNIPLKDGMGSELSSRSIFYSSEISYILSIRVILVWQIVINTSITKGVSDKKACLHETNSKLIIQDFILF